MEKSTVELVNDHYDQYMFGGLQRDVDKIGFFNFGYWKGIEDSVEIAQINLIETLISFFTKRDGNVLDVACGKGASTKFLTKYFDPNCITGINVSDKQLQVCRVAAPECDFMLMDAAELKFESSSFDNILCIEAAFHFMTRYRFFEQSCRVLRAGGRLAMSDVIVHDDRLLDLFPPKGSWPKENCLPSLDAYSDSLRTAGFKHVRVEDTTELSMAALQRFRMRKAEREFDRRQDYELLNRLMNPRRGWTWCMVYAIK